MHLSAETSTPCEIWTATRDEGVGIADLAKGYSISPFLLAHMLKAENVAYTKIDSKKAYDESHADEVASRLFAMGKLVSLRDIAGKTRQPHSEILSFFDKHNIKPLITLVNSSWYAEHDAELLRDYLRAKARQDAANVQRHRSEESKKRYAQMLAAAAPEGYMIIAEAAQKYGKTTTTISQYVDNKYVSAVKMSNRRYVNIAELEARIQNIKNAQSATMRQTLATRKRPAHDCPEGYVFMSDYCKQMGLKKTRIIKAIGSGHIHSVKRSVYVYVKPEDVKSYLAKMEALKEKRRLARCVKTECF